MTIYLIGLFAISLIYIMLQGAGVKIKSMNEEDIWLLLTVVLIVFLWGNRDLTVGLDTKSYNTLYEWASKASFSQYDYYWIEPGYAVLTMFCAQVLNLSYHHFILIVSVFEGYCLYRFVKRYSCNRFLSIIIFISFPLMAFYMSGIRNAIVISIMLISVSLLEDKKIWKIVLYEIIIITSSFLFHRSGVICALIPLFAYRNRYKHFGVIYVVIPAILLMSKGFIYRYITTNFKDVGNAGGISVGTSFIVYCCFLLLILFLNLSNRNYSIYDGKFDVNLLSTRLIYWSLIGALLSNGASDILSRMIIYYQMFYIIGIPNSIELSDQPFNIKNFIKTGTFSILLIYLYIFILSPDPYGIVPYVVYK